MSHKDYLLAMPTLIILIIPYVSFSFMYMNVYGCTWSVRVFLIEKRNKILYSLKGTSLKINKKLQLFQYINILFISNFHFQIMIFRESTISMNKALLIEIFKPKIFYWQKTQKLEFAVCYWITFLCNTFILLFWFDNFGMFLIYFFVDCFADISSTAFFQNFMSVTYLTWLTWFIWITYFKY